MIKGYLFDNNHVSAWYNRVPKVLAKVRSLPKGTLICTCATVLGEVEAGYAITQSTNLDIREDYIRWLNEQFLANCLEVTTSTRIAYAEIIGRLWARNPPRPGTKMKTERHLVQNFGIDINDVWIAACAREHNLVLVTHDAMEKIREVIAPDFLAIECWI